MKETALRIPTTKHRWLLPGNQIHKDGLILPPVSGLEKSPTSISSALSQASALPVPAPGETWNAAGLDHAIQGRRPRPGERVPSQHALVRHGLPGRQLLHLPRLLSTSKHLAQGISPAIPGLETHPLDDVIGWSSGDQEPVIGVALPFLVSPMGDGFCWRHRHAVELIDQPISR